MQTKHKPSADPREDREWRGVKCPTCGEQVPMLFGDQCNACNLQQLKRANATIERQTAVLEALVRRVELPLDHDLKYQAIIEGLGHTYYPRKYGYQRPITAAIYRQAKAALKGGDA